MHVTVYKLHMPVLFFPPASPFDKILIGHYVNLIKVTKALCCAFEGLRVAIKHICLTERCFMETGLRTRSFFLFDSMADDANGAFSVSL